MPTAAAKPSKQNDKRIDAYIAKSAEFAKPILTELRAIVHEACPQVEETLKWSSPAYMYKGILCMTPAFKQHCAIVFWNNGPRIDAKYDKSSDGRGQFGRITSLGDLPPKKVLLEHIRKAVEINDSGVKFGRSKPRTEKKQLVVPGYFAAALRKNRKAQATFDGFSYSHRKEYLEWITEAKTEETRLRRIAMALEWLAEGKSRNWKYERK